MVLKAPSEQINIRVLHVGRAGCVSKALAFTGYG